MRVSRYELHVTCKRAFAGLGFPDGVDEDAAGMIDWSELHGLPGLERLRESLPALDGTCSGYLPPPVPQDGTVSVDGGGQSILAIGSTALELATVLAGEQGCAEVILRNCRDQELAVPLAVRASCASRHIRLRWCCGAQIHICDVCDGARISSVPAGDAEPIAESVLHIVVDNTVGEEVETPEGQPRWSLSAEHARAVLANGIDVPDALRASLQHYGKRRLVPSTAESRAHGAGGGDANE